MDRFDEEIDVMELIDDIANAIEDANTIEELLITVGPSVFALERSKDVACFLQDLAYNKDNVGKYVPELVKYMLNDPCKDPSIYGLAKLYFYIVSMIDPANEPELSEEEKQKMLSTMNFCVFNLYTMIDTNLRIREKELDWILPCETAGYVEILKTEDDGEEKGK